MKLRDVLFICFWTPLFVSGQSGMWTFLKGDTTSGQYGVYGTQGISSPNNRPAGLYEAAEWTDTAGNFWLFGGMQVSTNNNVLWKYDPVTNNWTWVKGAPTGIVRGGNYGTQGVPALSNNPGPRHWGSLTWTDLNGDFWLYGGTDAIISNDPLADLWRFNVATNCWTWIKGPAYSTTSAVYGTIGVPSPSNTPGGRAEVSCSWVDSSNCLWFFGGDNEMSTRTNDLWKYNPATNEWTCMRQGTNFNGSYGVKGVASPSNFPRAMWPYASWSDVLGKFWFFGGGNERGGIQAPDSYNDMWMYDPATNNWTWMSGTDSVDNIGNYGSICTPSTAFFPRARHENRARWRDACGNFWMYAGGIGFSASGLSDLWCFSPYTLEWTLANGSNVLNRDAVYGTPGIASAANTPGSRGGAVSWLSKSGELYFFGGTDGYNSEYNTIWKFTIDNSCPYMPVNAVVNLGNDTTYCDDFFSRTLSTGDSTTIWSTGERGTQITVSTAGKYWALINGPCIASDTIEIRHQAVPNPFDLGADSVHCDTFSRTLNSLAPSAVWSNGAVTGQITINTPGTYWARVSNGCGTETDTVVVSLLSTPTNTVLGSDTGFCGSFSLTLNTGNTNTLWSTGSNSPQINVTTPGTYWATSTNFCGTASDTIIIAQDFPPTVDLGTDTFLCSGQTFTLNAAYPNSTYQWHNNSTNPTFNVYTSGFYRVTVTTSLGCSSSDSIRINFSAPVNVQFTRYDATTCGYSNGVVVFNVTSGLPPFSYLWGTGDTTRAVYTLSEGLHFFTVFDGYNCATPYQIVVLGSEPAQGPATIIAEKLRMCPGDSSQLCVLPDYDGYLWSTGDTTLCIYANQPGTYYVTTTDSIGCHVESNRVDIGYYNSLPISITVNGDTLTAFHAVSYQWLYNGNLIPGATSNVYVATMSGSYSVLTSDSSGCVSTSSVILITAIESLTEDGISVYPNPLESGVWNVECSSAFLGGVIDVYDARGRIVFQTSITELKTQLNFEAASGVYLLFAKTTQHHFVSRLVKL